MLFMAAQRKRVRRAQKKKMSDYPNTARLPGILNRTITSRERNWHSGGFGKDPKSRRMSCKTRLPAKGSSMGKLACWKTTWCIRQHREFYSGSPETKGSFRIEKSDFLHLTAWA